MGFTLVRQLTQLLIPPHKNKDLTHDTLCASLRSQRVLARSVKTKTHGFSDTVFDLASSRMA